MSRPKPGERAGALYRGKGGVIEVFGFGVYEGDFTFAPGPDAPVGWVAEAMMELPEEQRSLNPRIRLDSGQVVWGCECWWGSEAEVKRRLEAATTVVEVDIDQVRAEVRAEEAAADETP